VPHGRIATAFWISAAFVALSLLINRELLPHIGSALPGNAGDPMLNAWILGWVSDTAVSNPLAIWRAPIFHPHADTLAYSEHLFGVALFVAPVYWLTGDAILTYNVAFLAGYAFAGLAMFLLVRELTGRSDAAVVAGVLFACSPYLVSSHVARLQMLTCGWSALALMFLHRYVATGASRPFGWFIVCWALQALSNMYLGAYLALPVGVVVAHAALVRQPRLRPRQYAHLALGAAVLLAVLAPVVGVYARTQADMGFEHGLNEVRNYSADLRSYVSVWSERNPRWLVPEISSDRALFPGGVVIVMALAGWGAALARRAPSVAGRPGVALYSAIALGALVLSLGPEPAAWGQPLWLGGPSEFLYERVPGFGGFRAPARFGAYVLIAAAVVGGFGAAALLRGCTRSVRAGFVAVAIAWAAFESTRAYDWLALLDHEDPSATAAYAWLAAQPPGAVLELPVVTAFQAQRPNAGASATLRYQLATLRHRHPLINGSSGFSTPLVTLLQSAASPLTTLDTADDALQIVQAIGGRYIVVHRHEYLDPTSDHTRRLLESMRTDTARVQAVREFGSTVVLTLKPAGPMPGYREAAVLPPADYRVAVSHDTGGAAHLVDDNPVTRWAGPQRGHTWLDLSLRRPSLVSGIKLVMLRYAMGEYPHHLRVIGTGADGATQVLFDGPTVFAAAMTSVLEPAEPGVRLTWPATRLSRLRLEQRGDAGDRRWSIFELELHAGAGLGGVPRANQRSF
jgi:hypothetical protein